MENLIYEKEYELQEYIKKCLNELFTPKGTTVEEMLKYGFNNAYVELLIGEPKNIFEIGYLELDGSMYNYDFEYNKIKDLKVRLVEYEINDSGYYDIYLKPIDKETEQKFKEGRI